jgi:cell division protease FtsH
VAQYEEIVSTHNPGIIKTAEVRQIGTNNIEWYEITGEFTEPVALIPTNGTETVNAEAYRLIVVSNEEIVRIRKFLNDKGGELELIATSVSFWSVLFSILPYILIGIGILFMFVVIRNAGNAQGRNENNILNPRISSNKNVITFNDVAGCDEEKVELREVIDFLKNPKRYLDMGAKIPKGVLLVGAPGTGKTLLAKAVSGEAQTAFMSISGSDFVELYVGVGAARVRKLFNMAASNAPCVVFIDELDAVGRQRGAGLGGGNDEREQTLNQLLVELDGFGSNNGVIVMAATNRPDVLDKALLRPGRFDRQITIGLPDLKARIAILEVHARNKRFAPNVNFSDVAARIPGFSGADIANLLNEAALLATRENRNHILESDIDEAVDRVLMGPAKKSKKYSDKEKRLIAYHEAGHAVIGLKLEDAKIVQKITIIPRGYAGGYNLMVDKEDRMLSTKVELTAEIVGYLGGRVAEEVVFDTYSTGASNDFEQATNIARAMVTQYGMSDLGPIQYENSSSDVFLGRDYLERKNFSDKVAKDIDDEVRKIVLGCYERAKNIIIENRYLLDRISYYLIEIETITKNDIETIAKTGNLPWVDKMVAERAKKAQEPIVAEPGKTKGENPEKPAEAEGTGE